MTYVSLTMATLLAACAFATAQDPSLEIAAVPPFGDASISGYVANPPSGASASDFAVAPYVYWKQAWYAKAWIPLSSTWEFSGTYGAATNDKNTAFIVLAVVYRPSTTEGSLGQVWVNGGARLPDSLDDENHVAFVRWIERPADELVHFAGYSRWWKKWTSSSPYAPGPTWYSKDAADVFVDSAGALHLSITNKPASVSSTPGWHATEVQLIEERLHYGTYLWQVVGPLSSWDPSTVLGLFTYDPTDAPHYRELDFEFSRWGNPTRLDAGQHVIQPFNGAGGLRDVYHTTGLLPTAANLPQTEAYTAVMVWHEDHVQFLTLRGLFETDNLDSIPSASILRETIAWKETHTIPAPGRAQIHINLWQYQGDASFDANTVTPSHVTIPKFQMSASTSLVTPVQSESACRAANWCWCEDVGAGTAMPSCHRYDASCLSPHACTHKPAATCSDAVDDVHYLREANALVSSVCHPGSPWHDNCAMSDVTVHGVDYWLRRGLGPHAEVCY